MKFSQFYEATVALGCSKSDIDKMSLWEFTSLMDGWKMVNGVAAPEGHTEDEMRALGIDGF